MTYQNMKHFPQSFSHQELFGIEHDEFPSLDELLQLNLPERITDELSSEALNRVKRNLSPIHKICRNQGYDPLVIELSVIADRRLLDDMGEPYLVTCLSFTGSDNEQLPNAYEKAMEYMLTENSGMDPIIPHRGLYKPENVLIAINCQDFVSSNTSSIVEKDYLPRPTQLVRAYRFPFKQGKSEREVKNQVGLFVKEFLNEVSQASKNSPEIASIYNLLSTSHCLVVPFVRPYYEPVIEKDLTVIEKQSRLMTPTPSGAIILFLKQKEGSNSLKLLGSSLSWLIAAASVRESYSSLQVAFDKKELFGSMVHGTVNAIRSIDASGLCSSISLKTPPRDVSDLRVRIMKKNKDEEDIESARFLVSALRTAMLGEDTAAALLSFTEMNLTGGIIRKKFQNDAESKLSSLLEDAKLMINEFANRYESGKHKPVDVRLKQYGFKAVTEGEWVLPIGYINHKIVRGLLSEVIRNASEHGTAMEGQITLDCEIIGLERGRVRCTFINTLKDSLDSRPTPEITSGFLLRTKAILNELPGISIDFYPKEKNFIFEIELGPIQAESTDGTITLRPPKWVPVEKGASKNGNHQ